MKKTHILYLLLATLLLVGCGGGSGSSTEPPIQTFVVSTSAGQGGSINPSTATVPSGDTSVFILVSDTGYRVDSATGCGGVLNGNTYTTGAIASPCTVSATFVLNTYSVTASTGPGGKISPTNATVDHGSSVVFAVSPDTGFVVNSISGCGGSLTGLTYTTGSITASCAVTASFSTVAELLSGEYEGVMVSPKNIFFTDATNIIFAIDGYDASITKEAFFGRTCLLDGSLAGAAFPLTGSGTFQCSDFTEGTWSSSMIAKTNAAASLSEIEMTSGSDVYTIKVAGFRDDPVANYDPALDFWIEGVELADFVGTYDGNMQSLDSCAALTFSTSPSDLSVSINGNDILLQQDAFFEGVCRFEGVVDSFEEGVVAASGDYQCSNFDSGTWSTDRLVMTGDDSLFAELVVDSPSRGCSFSVKYSGFTARTLGDLVDINFVHIGRGSGSIGTTVFNDAEITFTARGLTSNRVSGAAFSIVHDSAAVEIEGVGKFLLETGTRTFVNNSATVVGFSREFGIDLFNGPVNERLGAWDMLSPIGPLVGEGFFLQWDPASGDPVETSGGVLEIFLGSSDAVFKAF